MTKLVLSAVLLAFLAVAPAGGQDIQLQPYRPQQEIGQSPDAARAFDSFERAWSRGDAGRVAELIPADGRASVSIESRGVSSQMGRGQIESVLAGLFSDVERAAFDLSTIQFSNEASAYAVGDWVYETRRGDARQRETVFVVFRESAPGAWTLAELRLRGSR